MSFWRRPAFFVVTGLLASAVLDVACPAHVDDLEASAQLEIRVNPRVYFSGATVHLTCRVTPDAANRWLYWGIEDYRQSRVQLDGENARITHEWFINNVPCQGAAFCRVVQADGRVILETMPLECKDRLGR